MAYIQEMMRKEPVSGPEIALCFAASLLVAAIVCVGTERIYRSERLAISA